MHKQQCVGAKGPLIPAILEFSCVLIFYSAFDASVRAWHWNLLLVFFLWLFLSGATILLIHRYTRVQFEYIWFSGQLVIRRHENGTVQRLAISQHTICGLYDRKRGKIGKCRAEETQNCCATLRGLLTCTELYYQNDDGRKHRLLLEPSKELGLLLWQATGEVCA